MPGFLLFALLTTPALADATPPLRSPVEVVLGPKWYRDGDVVEITDVRATSPRMEQGDTVVVRGRVRLDSQADAKLCLYLTQTEGDGLEETDAAQTVQVTEGTHDFELMITVKHRGALHVTLYDPETGRPFGGAYFGTAAQMKRIENWKLEHYQRADR